ncbi:MAG TPA: protease pro-enzyme activation domain-containing protein [Thermoplasmata archaeon]|nr:protease pro-enzyme activation domain-containing protein [Thermoplasmata archaeon]
MRALVLGTAVALAFLLALPTSTHAAAAPPPRTPASPLVTDAQPVPAGSVVVPLAASQSVLLEFTLPFANASRLERLLGDLSDPRSSDYRQFLSQQQFAEEFSPARSQVRSVESSLRDAGATTLVTAPDRQAVEAVLPAAAADRLLGVRLVSVAAPDGARGYTALGNPSLPSSLDGSVLAVDGLSDLGGAPLMRYTQVEYGPPSPAPSRAGQFVVDGSTGVDWYIGTDYAQAYGATELLPGGAHSVHDASYPTGVAVATILASGYNLSTDTTLPPWDPAVIDAYYAQTFPATWPMPNLTGVAVPITGVADPPAPGSFHGVNDSLGFEIENSLDLEMAGSLAPGARLYNFYFNSALLVNPTLAGSVSEYLADALDAALNYSYGGPRLAVVSCSFGLPDLVNALWDTELEKAAATGVTVLSASGDQGDAPAAASGRSTESAAPLWPATAAFNTSGVVAVGGVSVVLSGAASATYTGPPLNASYDTHVNGIAGMSAWWDIDGGFGAYAGTEGGTSSSYTEPSWQFHSAADPPIVNATEVEGLHELGRAVPDVAFPANVTIAYVSADAAGTPYFGVLGGTSIAAPVFAGLLADVVAVENASTVGGVRGLGFLDPQLYAIADYYRAEPGATDPYWDVTVGHNYLFHAAKGWDPTTGWGGLLGPLFLAADQNATVLAYTYTGPTPALPTTHPPAVSPLELAALLAAAAGVVLIATYAIRSSRARRRPVAPFPFASPPVPPPTWSVAPAPPGPPATFSCPYCGTERPAEPGHCPTCGAM